PTVSGNTHVGQVLTATGGSWTPAGTASAYQWLQCDSSGASCSSIGGATSSTYTLVAGDAGKTIRVQETASKSNYQSVAQNSSQTAVVAQTANTAAPTISGNAHVGQVLTATGGSWTPAGTASSYLWLQCDSAGNNCTSTGVTGTSYTL